jgi:hypothetical protein
VILFRQDEHVVVPVGYSNVGKSCWVRSCNSEDDRAGMRGFIAAGASAFSLTAYSI